MNRLLIWILYALLWLFAGMTLFVGFRSARTGAEARCVSGIRIEIADSSSHGMLVTAPMVREWLASSHQKLEGVPADKVDLVAVEELIAQNGFVGEVCASIGYEGELKILIRQREPLFRLLVDGYNHYVTADGFLFRAPHRSSLCVPVVTGGYKPPFEAAFEGSLSNHRTASALRSEERIAAIEPEKYPLYEREKKNREYHRETRRMFTSRRLLESRERFEERVRELRAHKQQRRRHYRYEAQQIELGLARIETRQNLEREQQKKLEKNYEDFQNLITFVKQIDADAFWRSEIVQIMASEAHSGALEVAFVPRSTSCVVELGRLEEVSEKLDRVEFFYREGLTTLGWDSCRTLSVRYHDRVVVRP